MWQTLSILAMLSLLFGAYFGLQNRKGLEDKISDRKQVETAIESIEGQIADSVAEFENFKSEKEADIAANETETVRKGELQAKLDDLNEKVAKLTKEEKDKKAELEKIESDTSGLPDTAELKMKLENLNKNINNLNAEIADLEANLANVNQQRTGAQSTIERYKAQEENQRNRVSPADLDAAISRSYQNFGFVILNGGYNKGIVPGSKLEVVRGEEVVGGLTVTSVEATQSAADIDGEALGEGVVLRSGDVVRAVRPVEALKPDKLPSLGDLEQPKEEEAPAAEEEKEEEDELDFDF